MSHLRLGNSLDKCVDMGAIVDPSQKKSIDEYVQDAKNYGAEVMKEGVKRVRLSYCAVVGLLGV